MTRYVAFLRGINLGNRRVKMAELRARFEELGLKGVGSHGASGNVAFDHEEMSASGVGELEVRIEGHLEASLGFFTDTMVRRLSDVEALTRLDLVEEAEADGLNVYITFAKTSLDAAAEDAFTALETRDDRFHVLGREVLWLRRGGISDSAVETRDLERAFGGAPNTRRKVTSLRRIVESLGT